MKIRDSKVLNGRPRRVSKIRVDVHDLVERVHQASSRIWQEARSLICAGSETAERKAAITGLSCSAYSGMNAAPSQPKSKTCGLDPRVNFGEDGDFGSARRSSGRRPLP